MEDSTFTSYNMIILKCGFTVPCNGNKSKATRIFMQGLVAYMREVRACSVHRMRMDFVMMFISQEKKKGEDGYGKDRCMNIYSNFLRRISHQWLLDEGPQNLTNSQLFSCADYIEKKTLDEYINLVERAIGLDKKYCNDVV